MAINPIEPKTEMLGYRLEKRIGSGGFGEVWAAEAPGGLKKAIKIVYGYHDEKRAQSELKALDRVKSLRHPFLLSLERIEIFESQLIVVTELADASMADLFNDYAAKGEPGIPREELLKYMSNAAEALDFLASEKSLQHLDIKPENLLIVSGHVKVADFGLMKDLQVATQSLMQGMTPAYAPPELFDGRPATSSDQYSLAILYMEMLTGVRPFPGNTPAQLAAQHMHGKPNLRALPKSDQSAVARALAKDPGARHPSCVAFVEDLKKQRRTKRKALRRNVPGELRQQNSSSGTFAFGGDSGDSRTRDVTDMVGNDMLPIQAEQIRVVDPPQCNPKENTLAPTLIVTIGDTANRVGQKIKSKLVSRAGNDDTIPAIQSIYIDSDKKSLGRLEMLRANPVSTLESVHVPLRKPEDYRANADVHLNWLGRRWIYNIPRTLQTEGLRPLGRLAFADHFNDICVSIERAIGEIVKAENLADTCESLQMLPGEVASPQVYIVSSISGGIGSGMTLDLAYTLKLLLAEKGLRDDNINAILLHSSYQRQRDPGLAAANTFAFMTEFRHFNEYGYPGDETLGIPEFEEEQPFGNTYYVELGDDLSQSEHEDRLGQIAEYVSLSTASNCRTFFQSARANEFERKHFALRSFGLSVTGVSNAGIQEEIMDRLGQKLVTRWINSNPEPAVIDEMANGLLSNFDLTPETIASKIGEATVQESESHKENKVSELVGIVASGAVDLESALNEYLDGYFGVPQHLRDASYTETELSAKLDQFISTDPIAGNAFLAKACMDLLDAKGMCLTSVEKVIQQIAEGLQDSSQNFRSTNSTVSSEISETISSIHRCKSDVENVHPDAIAELCDRLYELRKQEFVIRNTCEYYRVVGNGLVPIRTRLDQYKTNLEVVREEFNKSMALDFDFEESEAFDLQRLMVAKVEASVRQLTEKSELQVFNHLIETTGSFSNALADMAYWRYQLPAEIRSACRGVLRQMYESLSIDEIISDNNVAPEQLVQWLNNRVADARPRVSDCGGEMRLMFGFPTHSENPDTRHVITSNLNVESCVLKGTNGSMVVCFEAEDISFASVAFRLLAQRPDAVELVKRIRTRNDIDWTTLDDLL